MVRYIHTFFASVLVLSALFSIGPLPAAALDVDGNIYTSPTFDYQLQWSDPWVFIQETSDPGVDTLLISDGRAEATFLFAFAPGMTLDDFLAASLSTPAEGVSNVRPMQDAQGLPLEGTNGDQEWVVYTGDQTLADGSTVAFMQYLNTRSLEGGVVLAMAVVTVSYFWDDTTLQSWHDLASSALVTTTSGPPISTATATTVSPAPTAPVAPTEVPVTLKPTIPAATAGAGEPAPAFAAGPWRIAARAVDQGESIDYLGLGAAPGNQWVVVYADATNWSAEEATLDIASMTLAAAGDPIGPDLASTQSTATLLGLEPANGSSVTVPAGGSIRLALVYSIPLSQSELVLELEGTQLPLQNAVGQQLDVTDLSTIATPPGVQTGVLSTIFGGTDFMTLQVDTGAGPITIQLAGAEFPAGETCFDSALAMMSLSGLAGSTVRLETDQSVSEPDTYYVWIENPRGHWELLNQTLIAKGVAIESDLPEAARFGAWLEQTDLVAEANGTGLWSACAGQL